MATQYKRAQAAEPRTAPTALQVRARKLYDAAVADWAGRIEDRFEYADMLADETLRARWISFDCALVLPGSELIYLGVTSLSCNVFWAYDRKQDRFIDLGYKKIADPYDAKFHRSLVASRDGKVYAAAALLHDVDRYLEAPGGAIVEYDPRTGSLRKLGIPVPHAYIQGIALDDERRVIYCQTFTPEYLAEYHLDTGQTRILGLIGSGMSMGQGQNIVLDHQRRLWGGWSLTRAWQDHAGVDQFRLFRYDPDGDRIEFFRHGLPHLDVGRRGYAHLDGMIAAPNGMLYCGSNEGGLFRIDPDTAEVAWLDAPAPGTRIAAFAMGGDGALYGATGRDKSTSLFRLDLANEKVEQLGRIEDPETGVHAWQIHDMIFADDGTLFACENDNPQRRRLSKSRRGRLTCFAMKEVAHAGS